MHYPEQDTVMPSIKKILFPVDCSESSSGTARYVEAFAGRFEASVRLLHVVGKGEYYLPEELLPRRQAQLDRFLSDEFKYFTTDRMCAIGDPAAEIVKAARDWQADLVMLPTHGLGTFRRLLLGSVTAKVLHDLECPVWTSAHSQEAPPLEQIHCRKILCAVDLSSRSDAVLKWAGWLAEQYQAELAVVHATAELPPAAYGWNLEEDYANSLAEQASQAIKYLQTGAGTAAEVFIRTGDAPKVVAWAVEQFKADLLVMGRHSSSGIGGFLRQHAYAILRESPCPVISTPVEVK
jgi:nucleotide-binding universal stress UspA family protein